MKKLLIIGAIIIVVIIVVAAYPSDNGGSTPPPNGGPPPAAMEKGDDKVVISQNLFFSAPSEGTEWKKGETYKIEWFSTTATETDIELSLINAKCKDLYAPAKSSGCGKFKIASVPLSSESYSWTIPSDIYDRAYEGSEPDKWQTLIVADFRGKVNPGRRTLGKEFTISK